MNLARYGNRLGELTDTVEVWSDFVNFATGQDGWTSLVADAGTSAAVADGVNGVLALGTAATDNNEADVRTTTELFKFGVSRQIYGRAYIQYSEAATNAANVMVGYMSALAANSLGDNGGGVRATGDACVIYKIDGGTVWRCASQTNGVATDSVSTTTAGGSSYQLLEIELLEASGSTEMSAVFKVDGNYLRDSNDNIIRHQVTISGATDMNFGFYVKAGSANAETLNVDYGYAVQTRV